MKKSFYVMLAFVAMSITNSLAQVVTIGSLDDPKATLDVRSKSSDVTVPDGIIAPKLTGDELFAKNAIYGTNQNDALVYVTAAARTSYQTGKTINVKAPGYYYFDSAKDVWVAFATTKPEWFYMPPAALEVTPDTQAKTVDLFTLYTANIITKSVNSAGSPNFVDFCPQLTANDFYYYVVGYDTNIFANISITSDGKLTYTVTRAATDASYINIAFVRK